MGKKVFLKAKAHYLRPYFLDTGENLEDGDDTKTKIMKTEGVYTALVKLVDPKTGEVFTDRDEAIDYLSMKGVPTENLFGNLVKRDKETKEVFYKIVRPHMQPSFEDPYMGPPDVRSNKQAVDEEGNPVVNDYGKPVYEEWDKEVLIGNDSDITVRLDVWIGSKAKKITWEGLRVDELVPYDAPKQDVVGF